jgi:hypothetical protein
MSMTPIVGQSSPLEIPILDVMFHEFIHRWPLDIQVSGILCTHRKAKSDEAYKRQNHEHPMGRMARRIHWP